MNVQPSTFGNMRPNRFASLAVAAYLGLALIMGSFLGCQGCKSPAQTAYVVGQTSTITIEAAMSLWNEYVGNKHPGVEVEQKVKNGYDNYRKADIALLTAGKAMLEAQNADDAVKKTAAQTAWHQAEAALTASSGQLIGLLRDLGVKL